MIPAAIEVIDRLLDRERAALAEALNRADGHRSALSDLENVKAGLLRDQQLPDALTRKEIAALIGRTKETVRKQIRAALLKHPVEVLIVGPKREAGYPVAWCRSVFPTLPTHAASPPILAGPPTTCDSAINERQAEAPTE